MKWKTRKNEKRAKDKWNEIMRVEKRIRWWEFDDLWIPESSAKPNAHKSGNGQKWRKLKHKEPKTKIILDEKRENINKLNQDVESRSSNMKNEKKTKLMPNGPNRKHLTKS